MGTELGKAYVQIVPSAQGISGAITKELGGEARAAGQSTGATLAQKIKGVLMAAGIGAAVTKALSASINEGAALQQSIGGVETLFKDSADVVRQYANDAYKTAGLSANSYMEQVTSFSASLLQSLDGDTAAAAESAHQALVDMSDNANKFGTDIQSIQNAYQGFAKQNYTMLDNLKLGYGGTKKEMERLLQDAEKLTGIKYDINNLDDVYAAIHAIQEDLGITGTTAKEAATTFSGSFASMKAAASNFLGTLALGEDVTPALQGLVESTTTFLVGNLLPMVGNIVKALPGAMKTLVNAVGSQLTALLPQVWQTLQTQGPQFVGQLTAGIRAAFPQLWSMMLTQGPQIVSQLCAGIQTAIPQLLDQGVQMIVNLVNGILQNLPQVIQAAGSIVNSFASTALSLIPQVLAAGQQLLTGIVNGISSNLPQIVTSAANVIAQFAATVAANLPQILQSGIQMIGRLVAGIITAIPQIVATVPQIFSAFLGAFQSVNWASIGSDIIRGITNGISSGVGMIVDAAKRAAQSAFDAAKNALGIKSPSRLFRDGVGAMISEGMALGITDNISAVTSAMGRLTDAAGIGLTEQAGSNFSGSPASRKTGDSVTVIQNIYSQAQTAAELMREARYEQRRAVLTGA